MCEPSAFNPTSTFISISTSTSTFISTPTSTSTFTSTSTTWPSTFVSTSTSTQRPPHPPPLPPPPPLPQPEPLHLHLHLNHHFHLQLVECLYHGSVSPKNIKSQISVRMPSQDSPSSGRRNVLKRTKWIRSDAPIWDVHVGVMRPTWCETYALEHVNHFYLSLFQVGQAIVENLFQLTLPACPRASLFPAQARIYKYSFPMFPR